MDVLLQALSPSFALHWAINGSNIILGMDVSATASWVSLGIADYSAMKGADMALVYQDRSGNWQVRQSIMAIILYCWHPPPYRLLLLEIFLVIMQI